jgi:hypothetical protein
VRATHPRRPGPGTRCRPIDRLPHLPRATASPDSRHRPTTTVRAQTWGRAWQGMTPTPVATAKRNGRPSAARVLNRSTPTDGPPQS